MCNNILQTIHISWNAKLAELAKLVNKFLAIGVRQVSIFNSKISIHYITKPFLAPLYAICLGLFIPSNK